MREKELVMCLMQARRKRRDPAGDEIEKVNDLTVEETAARQESAT